MLEAAVVAGLASVGATVVRVGVLPTPGVAFLTLRSDASDKYAQPTGIFINLPGVPTGLSHDAPALTGATNVVLPGVDHRETSFGPRAFA